MVLQMNSNFSQSHWDYSNFELTSGDFKALTQAFGPGRSRLSLSVTKTRKGTRHLCWGVKYRDERNWSPCFKHCCSEVFLASKVS